MAKLFFRGFEYRGSEFTVWTDKSDQPGWWVLILEQDDEEVLRAKLPYGDEQVADDTLVGGYIEYWGTWLRRRPSSPAWSSSRRAVTALRTRHRYTCRYCHASSRISSPSSRSSPRNDSARAR